MFRFLKITRTRLGDRARTLLAQVRGYGSEGADDTAEAQDDVEVVQPLGLFARAVIADGLELLAAEIGDSTLGLAVINKALAALDVEEGETRVYSAGGSTCRVRLRADGSIDIEAASNKNIRITSAGSGDVVLNGGSLKVARVTDPTTGHTHTAVHSLTAPPGGGAVTGTITINSSTDTIASSGGAARVKA
jgi:hypothetical protein